MTGGGGGGGGGGCACLDRGSAGGGGGGWTPSASSSAATRRFFRPMVVLKYVSRCVKKLDWSLESEDCCCLFAACFVLFGSGSSVKRLDVCASV